MDQYIWGRSPPDLSDDRDKKLLFPQQEIFIKIVYKTEYRNENIVSMYI